MKGKPLIGIGSRIVDLPGKPNVFGSYETFVRAVEVAGGLPVILSPGRKNISEYVQCLDGLFLTGGGDIHPKFFGGKLPKARLSLSPEKRTDFELTLVKKFIRTDKPVLGICLGCQTINVALGGTLVQDIPSEIPNTKDHRNGLHRIRIEEGTTLHKIIGRVVLTVNSRHHQSVGRLGQGIVPSAFSPDQVIEAIESERNRFVVGVQWHPELLFKRAETKRLFRAFIRAAEKS